MKLHCSSKTLDLSTPRVMGVINITPDSFSDGGRFFSQGKMNLDAILFAVDSMLKQGADIIDIGGESTRPGAEPVDANLQVDRILPAIQSIRNLFNTIISVDTSDASVMREAINAGAHLINDVRALNQHNALEIIAKSDVAVCLMHMRGTPETMQNYPRYDNTTEEVIAFLKNRVDDCLAAGINKDRLLIDPGFGFGKTLEHNLTLLRELENLNTLDVPILVGVSRKRMIGDILGKPVNERLYGGLALAALTISKGAKIIRTHDVKPTVDVLKVIGAVIAK